MLFLLGGAGTGKSTVIAVLTEWLERILRKSGDDPNHPYIVKTCFTGAAASIISGQTLHSAFKFPFGNWNESYSNQEKDKRRTMLQNLRVVIIDEISMVKSGSLFKYYFG